MNRLNNNNYKFSKKKPNDSLIREFNKSCHKRKKKNSLEEKLHRTLEVSSTLHVLITNI